jgi:hypothetical protein
VLPVNGAVFAACTAAASPLPVPAASAAAGGASRLLSVLLVLLASSWILLLRAELAYLSKLFLTYFCLLVLMLVLMLPLPLHLLPVLLKSFANDAFILLLVLLPLVPVKHYAVCALLVLLLLLLLLLGSPLYLPTLSSCRRVLMTSMGCRQHASIVPPMEPGQRNSSSKSGKL